MLLERTGRLLVATFYERPVFIIGTGRSGTGALKQVLGAHRQILACDGESPLVSQVAALITPYSLGQSPDYHRRALRIGLEELDHRLKDLCFESACGSRIGLRRVLREVVRGRKVPFRLKYWCAKTFPDLDQARALKILYPSAKLIYIFRNGCEVVHSRMKFPPMRHRSFAEHCEGWARDTFKFDYVESFPDATTLRHEEFVESSDRVLSDIWRFLGIDHDERPALLARTTLVHSLDVPTRSGVDVRSALMIREPPYARWDADQKETFKKICGEAMEMLGYEIPF